MVATKDCQGLWTTNLKKLVNFLKKCRRWHSCITWFRNEGIFRVFRVPYDYGIKYQFSEFAGLRWCLQETAFDNPTHFQICFRWRSRLKEGGRNFIWSYTKVELCHKKTTKKEVFCRKKHFSKRERDLLLLIPRAVYFANARRVQLWWWITGWIESEHLNRSFLIYLEIKELLAKKLHQVLLIAIYEQRILTDSCS